MDCIHCTHFFVTWEKALPYGCKAWGIKTPRYPEAAVYASSGLKCQLFKPKNPANRGGPDQHRKR